MTINVMTRLPKRGDLEVRRISDSKPFYIKADTLDVSSINTQIYEIIGPVIQVKNGKVLVAYKDNASKPWCERYFFTLAGYTLDGKSHTGVLSIRESSSASANTDYTVTYSASSMYELAEQLNTYFKSTPIFDTQDWMAEVIDGVLKLHFSYTFWQQAGNNTGKSGFTLSASLLPDVTALANIRRKHGGKGGEGVISSWDRALAYFRQDNGADSRYMGGVTTAQTSIKQSYPINLPTWLGTSTKNPGNFCTALHEVYGTGEEGWLKFMASCLPVLDCDNGNIGQDFGKEMTALLAFKTYSSRKKTDEPMCKAAHYCYNIVSPTIQQGEFYLGTPKEIAILLDGIHYGTNGSRNSDVVNATLNKIGGKAISNGSYVWSCSRYGTNYAWLADGNYGGFSHGYMCISLLCVPVSLHEL